MKTLLYSPSFNKNFPFLPFHRLVIVAFLFLIGLNPLVHSQSKVTLRLTDWADLDEIPLDEQAIAEFKKRYPWIDVLYEPNPGRQYEEKILTALAADEPPDVFLLDSKLIPTFTNKKILLDLTPFIAQHGIDTAQWYPNVLNIARKGPALYAFPKGFTPLMVYYNKRLFDEANIPYPSSDWTWDDYLEIAKKLTKDLNGDGTIDQYGAEFDNRYFYWIPWVWSADADVVSKDGRRVSDVLNSPQTQAALQFLIDLRVKHNVAPATGTWVQAEKTGAHYQLFANGKIAMHVDGHWRLPRFADQIEEGKLELGVAPFPRHPSGKKINVMYESGWCVPVSAKHPKEAALLAAFMAGETANRIRASRRLEIPSVIKVAEDNVANDKLNLEKAFVDEIPFCRQPWGSLIERFSEIEWTLQDAVDEVMLNGKPMHETMSTYASRIDNELENIRKHESLDFKPIKEHTEILKVLIGVTAIVFIGGIILYTRARGKARATTGTAISFLAPSIFHLIVFVFTPILFAAYLSLHRWDIVVPEKPFVGLDNFKEMLSDDTFWNALKNTFLYSLNVPLGMIVSLVVAMMVNRKVKGIAFLRMLYFLPSVTSFVAIALVWMWIYHPTFGLANFVLGTLGLGQSQWLNSTNTAMISIIIFSIWLGIGYQMVIFLAGLQGIPGELYDAAHIDGANNWKKFWRITLPLLKPTTFFILVTSLISSFQVFTSIYIMTAGGPVRSTDVLVYHIYQSAWEQLRMGYASAMSWVLFVIIMIATWIQFKLIGNDVEYS
ncbi:MAG: extracellular solute-binding protein [Ignavibacteriales bacterium]|nr:extracellular solute-binding protein [Ignavibacteriales bacterium]